MANFFDPEKFDFNKSNFNFDSGNFNVDFGGNSEFTKQLKRIDKLRSMAQESGIEPDELEPRRNLFFDALNFIDKGKQAVVGVLDTALVRGDLFQDDVGLGIERAWDEKANTFDILRREGLDEPITRAVLGFAGEVLLDPLTYITGGTSALKNVPHIGNKAVREAAFEGAGKIGKFISDVNPGLDFIDSSKKVRNAMDSIGEIRRLEIVAEGSGKAKNALRARQAKTDIVTQKGVLRNMGFGIDQINALVKESKDNKWFYEDGLNFGISGPLVGLFEKGKAGSEAGETFTKGVIEEIGGKASLFKKAGDVAKFGTVRLGEIPLPKEFLVGAERVKASALNSLNELETITNDYIAKLDEIPGVGKYLGGTAAAAKKLAKLPYDAAKLFQKTFLERSFIGKQKHNAKLEYKDALAGIDTRAEFDTFQAFPQLKESLIRSFQGIPIEKSLDDTLGLAEANARATTMVFDTAVDRTMQKVKAAGLSSKDEKTLLHEIAKAANGQEYDVEVFNKLGITDDLFLNELSNIANELELNGPARQMIEQTSQLFKQIRAEELKLGIDTPLFSYYVPHRYTNIEMGPAKAKRGRSGVGAVNPLEGRTFATLKDALRDKGLVPNFDIRKLYYQRLREHYRLVANKEYFNQMALHNALPITVMKNLAKEAREKGEDSAAYKLLNRQGYDTRGLLGIKSQDLGNLDKELEWADLVVPDLSKEYRDGAIDNIKTAKLEVLESTGKDAKAAQASNLEGKLGKEVEILGANGKRERYILPEPLVKAIEETQAGSDFIKKMAKDTEFEPILNAYDSAIGWWKAGATRLFPGYWAQNTIGDRLLGWMDDTANLNPTTKAETLALLQGKGALKTPTGWIDASQFQEILRRYSIGMTANELIDVADATSKTADSIAFEAFEGSTRKAILGNEPLVAVKIAQKKLTDKFENFFRIQTLVSHLKRGDSIPDAVRLTNDALINYRDLSPIEQSIARRTFMFYGWLSKSTKKSLNSLFFRPGDIQKQMNAAEATAELFSDPNAAASIEDREMDLLKSRVAQEQVSFPIGKTPDGDVIVGRGFGLPLNTLLQQFAAFAPRNASPGEVMGAFMDSAMRTTQKAFASSNPVVKGIVEGISGKNMYFDRPLSAKFLRKVPTLAQGAEKIAGYPYDNIPIRLVDDTMKWFLKAVPGEDGYLIADPYRMYLAANFIPAFGRAISTLRGVTDINTPLAPTLLRSLTGVRLDYNDPDRTLAYEQENYLKELLIERSVKDLLKAKKL